MLKSPQMILAPGFSKLSSLRERRAFGWTVNCSRSDLEIGYVSHSEHDSAAIVLTGRPKRRHLSEMAISEVEDSGPGT